MPGRTRSRSLAAVVGALVLVAGAARGAGAGDTGDVANDGGLQWGFDRIGAEDAWSRSTGAGVTIAVIDSGVAVDHEDLAGNIADGIACRGTGGDPTRCTGSPGDDDGHGTHVSGIAAAVAGNGAGIAGVAPGADLLPVKVLFRDCEGCQSSGTSADVTAGIRWAADRGADVINLSLGSITQSVVGPGRAFADALDEAWSKGAIPVLVAGNDLVLPGSLLDVPAVVVSATNGDDEAASYSNGVGVARWAVAAPGGESDTPETCEAARPNGILSTFFQPGAGGGSGYACVAGTSMAAPHVSGALAILRSAGLDPAASVDRLLATATDLGPGGRDGTFGAGRIDLARAVEGLAPTGQGIPTADDPGSSAAGAPAADDATAEHAGTNGDPAGGDDTTGTTSSTTDPAVGATVPAAPTGTGSGRAAASPPGGGDDRSDVPAGPLTVAVLAVAAVGAGHAWRLLAASNLARRTPSR